MLFYRIYLPSLLLFFIISCQSTSEKKENKDTIKISKTFTTPLGKTYSIAPPSKKMLDLFESAKAKFNADPNNVVNIIWYGRRSAYLGNYKEAIDIYSAGIKKYPEESRLYRHRGHRYISIREFDKAIADLGLASKLIKGKKNELEPDGLPNAQNIPVSSKHGNIWYHLGLAYYLKGDMEKSFEAYSNCKNATTNDDNIVSATHWLYMIQQRLGNKEKAKEMLEPIHKKMEIIENHSYFNLCQFYKELIPIDSLKKAQDGSQNAATQYGIANWYYYNQDTEKAKKGMEELLEGNAWNSFGYIAAESDYLRFFQ